MKDFCFSSSLQIVLKWIPQDNNNDKSTLAQVMAWCRPATGFYFSLCWTKSMSPYGATSP